MPMLKSSTGNPALDLLNVLEYLQYMELFLVLVLGFYFVLIKLEWDKTESFIEKYIPVKLQKFVKWYVKSLKISVNSLFVWFWFLLLMAILISCYDYNLFL